MTIRTTDLDYKHADTLLSGFLACDDALSYPRPAVLVSHAWAGRDEFVCAKAIRLAELGYVGFALDLYGKGVLGRTRDENARLMQPFLSDRAFLQGRMVAALEFVRGLPQVDSTRIGAIGFCFGGLCVLDLARTGVDLRGVVSFHGLLSPPDNIQGRPIQAKILVLHGYEDPMVPPEQVMALARELTEAGADWQIHMYGNTLHAFTNPQANDLSFGTVYDENADRRSWQSMQQFLAEVLD